MAYITITLKIHDLPFGGILYDYSDERKQNKRLKRKYYSS